MLVRGSLDDPFRTILKVKHGKVTTRIWYTDHTQAELAPDADLQLRGFI